MITVDSGSPSMTPRDTTLINMHKAPKFSAEGHGCTPQFPDQGEGHTVQGHCLLYNPLLLKSSTSYVTDSWLMNTEISVISL